MKRLRLETCAPPVAAMLLLGACADGPLSPPAHAPDEGPFGPGGGFHAPVYLTQIGPEAFSSPTVIDFETTPLGPVGDLYADLGVTMVNLNGVADEFDFGTEEGLSHGACNFDPSTSDFPPAELLFDPPVARVGFDIVTMDPDDATVTAYLDGTEVGSELFDTGGGIIGGGSFAGVEFEGPFDRLVIDPADNTAGAGCIDNLMFEASEATAGPETVEEAFSELSTLIGELRDQGVLNRGQANSLTRKLQVARMLMDRGVEPAALNLLNAFVHQVQDLAADGVLGPSQADALVALAQLVPELM